MVAFESPAYAKLNVFLRVLGRRDDGYHDVETLLLPISLADHVTAESAESACATRRQIAQRVALLGRER